MSFETLDRDAERLREKENFFLIMSALKLLAVIITELFLVSKTAKTYKGTHFEITTSELWKQTSMLQWIQLSQGERHGIEPVFPASPAPPASSALADRFFTTEPPGKPRYTVGVGNTCSQSI